MVEPERIDEDYKPDARDATIVAVG